jgi:predicted amidohydrolase YtcJ
MSSTDRADLVLTGGQVFTADPANSWARAVAVRGNRIVAVGSDREVMEHAGPSTRVIGLRGRTVTPGFGDAHVHPISSGLERFQCNLHDAAGIGEYLERVAAYAAANPDLPWILGGGWYLAHFPGGLARREDLDRVIPDRPVYLPNKDGHDAWVNSRALELAGVTADTPDPHDGRIARDADGTPLGTLHEGAQSLVEHLIPPTSPAELERGLLESQAYLHGLGITNWQDAIVGAEDHATYLRVAGRGDLTARVVGALWWEHDDGLEQIEGLVARRAQAPVGRYAATSVKLVLDGIVENYTAAMLDAYFAPDGTLTDNRGMAFIEPEILLDVVPRLDALGFQAHFHALGDRAVRYGLDAIEAARRQNGWTDTRPHLAHLQVVHPDDLPRFRQLGALANVQALWAVHEGQMDDLTLPVLGPVVSARQYPLRSFRRHGATVVMGSDWSVSTADPFAQMDIAVNRVIPGHEAIHERFMPEEALELTEALVAFTAGSAYASHLDEAGTIAVGRLADLAVLDRDLFDRGAGGIADTRVVATVVDGVVVHETPALDG